MYKIIYIKINILLNNDFTEMINNFKSNNFERANIKQNQTKSNCNLNLIYYLLTFYKSFTLSKLLDLKLLIISVKSLLSTNLSSLCIKLYILR